MGDTMRRVVGFVAVAGGVVIGVTTGNWMLAASVAYAGYNMITQPQETTDVAAVQRQQGAILETRVGGAQMLPVVYGTTKLGGVLADTRVDDASPGRKLLYVVTAFCHGSRDGGDIEAIDELWFDDQLAIDPSGPTILDPFTSFLTYTYHLGSDSQAVDSDLNTAFPTEWPSSSTGHGVAYATLGLTYEQTVFPGGIPNIQALIRGNRVFDVRDSTWKHSDNPALCIRDYLLSDVYGMGLTESQLDDDSFVDAANYCDELVTDPDGGTQKRFTLNGWVNTSTDVLTNLAELLTSCRGSVVNEGDNWRIVIRQQRSTSGLFVIDENNAIEGSWQFVMSGARDVPNVVRTTYIDPARDYQAEQVEWPEAGDSNAFLTEDANLERMLSIDLPFTDKRSRAQQIGMTLMKEARFGDIGVIVSLREEAIQARVGDLVEVHAETPGWSGKVFDVIATRLRADTIVDLVLIEYDAAAYDLDAQAVTPSVPNSNLPDPFSIEPPGDVVVLSDATTAHVTQEGNIIPRVLLMWVAPDDPFLHHYEVQIRGEGVGDPTSEYKQAVPDPLADALEVYITGLTDAAAVDIRIRAVNTIGVVSEWVELLAETIATQISNKILNAFLTEIPFVDISASSSGVTEKIRPDGDVGSTADFGGGTLYLNIDGNLPDTGTSIVSGTGDLCPVKAVSAARCSLGNPIGTPAGSSDQEMYIRVAAEKTESGGVTGKVDIVLKLYESAVLIGQWTQFNIDTSNQIYEFRLTNAQVDAIGNHNNLEIAYEVHNCFDFEGGDIEGTITGIELSYFARIPAVRGVQLDLVYDVTNAVDELDITTYWDDGAPQYYNYVIPVSGIAGKHRLLMGSGVDLLFEEGFTDFMVDVTPIDNDWSPPDTGRTVTLFLSGQSESPAGVKAEVGGSVLQADYFVAGANIEIDTDPTGRLRINAAGAADQGGGPGASMLSQLTDVSLNSLVDADILRYNLSSGMWVNEPLTVLVSDLVGGTFGAGDYTFPANVTITNTLSFTTTQGSNLLAWNDAGTLRRLTTGGGFGLEAENDSIIYVGNNFAALIGASEINIVAGTVTEDLWLAADDNVTIVAGRDLGALNSNPGAYFWEFNGTDSILTMGGGDAAGWTIAGSGDVTGISIEAGNIAPGAFVGSFEFQNDVTMQTSSYMWFEGTSSSTPASGAPGTSQLLFDTENSRPVHRFSWNDGLGNFQFRSNHYSDGVNERHTLEDHGAVNLQFQDTGEFRIESATDPGGVSIDSVVSWDIYMLFDPAAPDPHIEINRPLYLPDGTVGAPALSFTATGQQDVGIYREGTDDLRFATGGAARLSITGNTVQAFVPFEAPNGTGANPSITFAGNNSIGFFLTGAFIGPTGAFAFDNVEFPVGADMLTWNSDGTLSRENTLGGFGLHGGGASVIYAGEVGNRNALFRTELNIDAAGVGAEDLFLVADEDIILVSGRHAGAYPSLTLELTFNSSGGLVGPGWDITSTGVTTGLNIDVAQLTGGPLGVTVGGTGVSNSSLGSLFVGAGTNTGKLLELQGGGLDGDKVLQVNPGGTDISWQDPNNHTHPASDITTGTFAAGNFTFQAQVTMANLVASRATNPVIYMENTVATSDVVMDVEQANFLKGRLLFDHSRTAMALYSVAGVDVEIQADAAGDVWNFGTDSILTGPGGFWTIAGSGAVGGTNGLTGISIDSQDVNPGTGFTGGTFTFNSDLAVAAGSSLRFEDTATASGSGGGSAMLIDLNSGRYLKRMTWNDGGGNWNFLLGAYWDGTANHDYIQNDVGAVMMEFVGDTGNGAWLVRTAGDGGPSGQDTNITWSSKLQVDVTQMTWGTNSSTGLLITTDGNLRAADNAAGDPSYSFANSTSTGMYYVATSLRFSVASTNVLTLTTTQLENEIDGSQAAPSYTWGSDPNTGMWRQSEGAIGFSTNNALALHLDQVDQWSFGGAWTDNSGTALDNLQLRRTSSTVGILLRTGLTHDAQIAHAENDTSILSRIVFKEGGQIDLQGDQVWIENGTKALPGLAFASETESGLWNAGVNQLGVATNHMRIQSPGATNSPTLSIWQDTDRRANLQWIDAGLGNDSFRIGVEAGQNNPIQFASGMSGSDVVHMSIVGHNASNLGHVHVENAGMSWNRVEEGAAGGVTCDWREGNVFDLDSTGTSKLITLNSNSPPDGFVWSIFIHYVSGSGLLTWDVTIRWPGSVAPSAPTSGETLWVTVTKVNDNGSTRWIGAWDQFS